jgi:hypothetical protein
MRAMKQFLRKHRFDIFLAITCAIDVVAFTRFPLLCEFATGAMVFGMVMDHKRQGTKTGPEDL